MNRKLIIAIVFTVLNMLVASLMAQEKVSLALYQDARLGLLGDNKGNKAGTLNIIARFKMQGNQQKWGYLVIFPEFEYAELQGNYKRYSANAGYTLNKLLINKVEASSYIGFGWIDRYNASTFSWSASGELAYKINRFKISLLGQLTERTDLLLAYDKNEIRFSGFIGLEFNIN